MGKPRLPQDILDRGLRGILDRNRVATSPLEWATVVRPLGGGEHIIDERLRVGSVAPEASFIPGTRVLVAAGSADDAQGRVIVGFSPPIQGGSKAASTVHGTLPLGITAPSEIGPAAYRAFFDPGGGPLTVSTYDAAGHYIEDIAPEITGALTAGFYVSIPHDSFDGVGDGTIAAMESDGTITTIDPVAGTLTNFAGLTATYKGLGVGYAGGWLYLIEAAPLSGSTTTIRLRKVRTDGSGMTTVSSVVLSPAIIIDGAWSNFLGFRMTATSAIAAGPWGRQDGSDGEDMVFPLDGSTPTVQESPNDTSDENFQGIAYPSGSLGTMAGTGKSTAPGIIHASWTPFWTGVSDSPQSFDTNATEAMVFADGVIYRGLFATLSGSPTTTVTAEPHPILGAANLMFML